MKPSHLMLVIQLLVSGVGFAQPDKKNIYTDVVLLDKRTALENDLRYRLIAKTFSSPIDSNSEYRFQSACDAVSQFQFANSEVEQGFLTLFDHYDALESDTKQSFLQAVYAVYPKSYAIQMQVVLQKETDPKLFAICAAYLFRFDTTVQNENRLKIALVEKFPGYDSVQILQELVNYLTYHCRELRHRTPDISQLFRYQKITGQKIIYSFQRWDRDFPGLAIIQKANGDFVRDGNGRLMVFQQLARSATDLPYFISNGSTPQGVYSIQGTSISRSYFIGPTPNIQLLIPFEGKWSKFFHEDDWGEQKDSLVAYRKLLPPEWRKYRPMMEVWSAGKAGRSEIIAHGTTIDPEYFKQKPYYPLTPTEGCLCAKELWNNTTGHLLVSEQFDLVNAFQSTPGSKGLLYVINLDDEQKAVTREDVEKWVRRYQTGRL